jgi:hypothetical protein
MEPMGADLLGIRSIHADVPVSKAVKWKRGSGSNMTTREGTVDSAQYKLDSRSLSKTYPLGKVAMLPHDLEKVRPSIAVSR